MDNLCKLFRTRSTFALFCANPVQTVDNFVYIFFSEGGMKQRKDKFFKDSGDFSTFSQAV